MSQPGKVKQKKIIIQVKVALIKSRSGTKKKKKRKKERKAARKKFRVICGTFMSATFLRVTFSAFQVVLSTYLRLNASHIEVIQMIWSSL